MFGYPEKKQQGITSRFAMTEMSTGRAQRFRASYPGCRSGLAAGTGVLTTDGILPVEYLIPGDGVISRDAGVVALGHVVSRTVPARDVLRVRPRALDPEAGTDEFFISARQELYLTGWRARAMFGQPAALVAAERLVDGAYISRLAGSLPVELFQLTFADAQHLVHLGEMDLVATSERMPVRQRA
jgi:hypothetical protein